MKPLKIGENLTLNVGDFIVIADNNNVLSYGWYCGQGKYSNTLQYYDIFNPGNALIDYERFQAGDKTGWRTERFEKHGFTSKCFYKTYINSWYESRILKPGNPDELFTNPEQLERYKKSKEALIKIKFLQK